MYVNDEPLVFSERFVFVVRFFGLLQHISLAVWWSVGFTVVFCVQPPPYIHDEYLGRGGGKEWKKIKINKYLHVYYILVCRKITQGVQVGGSVSRNRIRTENTRQVFLFPSSLFTRLWAVRRGIDDLWKSYSVWPHIILFRDPDGREKWIVCTICTGGGRYGKLFSMFIVT